MRNFNSLIVWLVGLALTGLLAACGSSAGGGDELGTAPATSPATSPAPVTQGSAVDGQIVYDRDCARCHILQPSDPAGFAPDLAGKGDVIAVRLQGSHNGVTLTATELEDVIAFANAGQVAEPAPEPDPTPAPAPDPTLPPVGGQTVYDANCAGCHRLGSYDTAGAPELVGKGTLVTGKLSGGHMGISLTTQELTALIGWIDQNTPAPEPTPAPAPAPAPAPEPTPAPAPAPVDGKTVYDGNCAACHRLGSYDTAGSPELAGKGSLVSSKIGGGHMGLSLSTEAVNALVGWIDQNSSAPAPAPAPVPAPAPTPAPAPAPQCGSCHALPPGDTAHAAHQALPGVGSNCAVCHPGSSAATHNDGWVDLTISAIYNAKTGAAAENPDGTASCVTVSCHGGQTTPDWGTGTINVNTQCTSCHARGTTQYNSYNSGQHGRSDHTRQACTACHNTTSLASTHFSRLDTPTMEGPAAATVGGGTTRVSNYNASTRTCTTSCHGSESW